MQEWSHKTQKFTFEEYRPYNIYRGSNNEVFFFFFPLKKNALAAGPWRKSSRNMCHLQWLTYSLLPPKSTLWSSVGPQTVNPSSILAAHLQTRQHMGCELVREMQSLPHTQNQMALIPSADICDYYYYFP